MPWDLLLILFVLAVIVPWRGVVRVRRLMRLPSISSMDRLTLYASTIAFQWVGVTLAGWRAWARGVSAESLGLRLSDPASAFLVAAGFAVLLSTFQVLALRRMGQLPPEKRGFLQQMAQCIFPQNGVEQLAYVALVATVAVCEEFLYRGFVYAALDRIEIAPFVLPALGSSLIFALAHLYQGRRGLITTFIAGVLFAGLRVWSGSLAPGIVVHFVVDLVAGLAGPRLVAKAARQRFNIYYI